VLPRLTLPPSPALLALVAAAFLLPGLVSHDLWKTQDAIGLGIVHAMAESRNLLVPQIAGTPWLYDQPLYHWVALAFGWAFGWLIEFHGAARLASGAFVAAAFACIYAAARAWMPGDALQRRLTASAAMLLLLGCVGLLVHAHEALPELAALASIALALAALPYAAQRPVAAGAVFGAGLALAFLSAMWTLPAGLGAAVLIAHLACPEWRTRRGAAFVAIALVTLIVVALPWPLALAQRSGAAFLQWWAANAQPQGTTLTNLRHFFATASWFCWPAWPLALWAAWSLRRQWREPRLLVPALAVLSMLALYGAWGPTQDESLIGLLAPLSLLGAQGIFTLRRGAMAALDWFGALTFAVFTALVWIGWSAMLTGLPGPVARNFGRMAPGFAAELRPFAVLAALLLAAAWLYLMFFTRGSPMRSIARWALGIVLLWGTFAMLWLPWVDYQRSYRSVAHALRVKIPGGARCIALRYVGVSQAAALDYHGGIRGQLYDVLKPAACPLVLVQGTPAHELDAPARVAAGRWVKLADVGRPGDRTERYRLYRLSR